MKKIILIVLMSVFIHVLFARVDLNQASLSELRTLPITEAQARAIYEYRTFIAFFESIFDLRQIDSIDQQTLDRLRPLVSISLYTDLDYVEQRREEIYYLLERLGSQEGIQAGFTDIWEDYLMSPRDINKMRFRDLLNMPNVSPIDAAAISRRLAAGDEIVDYRNMRSTVGLSHYGATNLRHYVHYKDPPEMRRIYMNYQFKYEFLSWEDDIRDMYREVITNSNTTQIDRDMQRSYWGYFNLAHTTPAISHKYRIRLDDRYKAGVLTFNQIGENPDFSANPDIARPNKFFVGFEDRFNLWGANDIKVYAGNFRVTYGEGLVIENTDYYSSRKTGHGFSKRILGITEDLSRSQQYALQGFAFELQREHFSGAFWYSNDKKDAVVWNPNSDGNLDGSLKNPDTGKYHVLSYITPTIRFDNDDHAEAERFFNNANNGLDSPINMHVRTDIMTEEMIGGRFEYSPWVGTHVGFTTINMTYPNAHFVVPEHRELGDLLIRNHTTSNLGKWRRIDSQISGLYSTYSPGEYERNFRRIHGIDWRTVLGNTSFQGEYAELNVEGNAPWKGNDPSAIVLSTYSQFENLYFLALYRNYDVRYDNPYNRAFSEHRKFNNTLFDGYARLLPSIVMGDLYYNSAEPQAEEGFYFETRYRFSQNVTLNRTYIDIFERKADGRRTVRFQTDVDYRPIYQLSFRVRYKHQINRYDDFADRGVSETVEPSFIVTSFLSNRDRLQVEYRYTQVKSPPYPYLTNSAVANGTQTLASGQVLMHGDFVRIDWIHNLNEKLRFRSNLAYWNGHSISHWDFEDVEIDFLGEHGIKYWILVQNKIANNVYLSLKYKTKYYRTKELIFRAWWNADLPEVSYFRNVNRSENDVRLQIDSRY